MFGGDTGDSRSSMNQHNAQRSDALRLRTFELGLIQETWKGRSIHICLSSSEPVKHFLSMACSMRRSDRILCLWDMLLSDQNGLDEQNKTSAAFSSCILAPKI